MSAKQLGAQDEDGTDYYVVATKVLLEQSLLLNLQLRYTRANQFGLLGFGGDRDDGYSSEIGGSVGYLLTRRLAIGAAYLNIGSVLAPVTGVTHDQSGPYLSLQAGF